MFPLARTPLLHLDLNQTDQLVPKQVGPIKPQVETCTASSSSVLSVCRHSFLHPRTRYRSATHTIIPVLITGIQHSGLAEVKEKKEIKIKDNDDWFCPCQESYNSGNNRSPCVQCCFCLNWQHENCQSVDLNNAPTVFMCSECAKCRSNCK
jgi:hypothetical protein